MPERWAPGEKERFELWMTQLAQRMQFRGQLEMAFSATDTAPYESLYWDWEAWKDFEEQLEHPMDDTYPESPVVKNQNVGPDPRYRP